MTHHYRCVVGVLLRLIVGLALLGFPRIGWAAGTWSVISLPQQPGKVGALATDGAGNLYVGLGTQIQQLDAQGSWLVLATEGDGPGQVDNPTTLAVDSAGNVYIADLLGQPCCSGRIQKRDAQGNWSVIAIPGGSGYPFELRGPRGLAVDRAGNLYIAEVDDDPGGSYWALLRRDTHGNWSDIGDDQVHRPAAIAVDTGGNLYIADTPYDPGTGQSNYRIQKRGAQGGWSVIATAGADQGQSIGEVYNVTGLAVDAAGSLYVAEQPDGLGDGTSRIQTRDAQGNWAIIAAAGSALGQVSSPTGLAVTTASNLYVADAGNNRVLKYTPGP